MSMYHNRPTVADMRAMKARGQKISMIYVTTLEEAAAAAAAGIHMLSIEGRSCPTRCVNPWVDEEFEAFLKQWDSASVGQ